jgi:hypothetical protein
MVDDTLLSRVDARAAELGQTRRVFAERALEAALLDDTQAGAGAGDGDSFLDWAAGFIDGEGCFAISRNTVRGVQSGHRCRMNVRLRDDDIEVLNILAQHTGVGVVRHDKAAREGENAQAVWEVMTKADCAVLCRILDAHPLRAKKARDYSIWREAVEVWKGVAGRNGGTGADPAQARLATLKEQLEGGRRYEGASRPAASPRPSTRNTRVSDQDIRRGYVKNAGGRRVPLDANGWPT